MELRLERIPKGKVTLGKLYINGEYQCDTLEDEDRGLSDDMPLSEVQTKKVYANTCIPKGKYTVIISYSNRFKKYMPLISNVKGFLGIRIHAGNTIADTEGCIIVGTMDYDKGVIKYGTSRKAYDAFYSKLVKVHRKEKITLEIV